eukprot:3396202-Rhodomonas_salina.2
MGLRICVHQRRTACMQQLRSRPLTVSRCPPSRSPATASASPAICPPSPRCLRAASPRGVLHFPIGAAPEERTLLLCEAEDGKERQRKRAQSATDRSARQHHA